MRKAHICFLDMKKNEFFRSDFRYEKVWVYNEEISNLILDINNKKIKKRWIFYEKISDLFFRIWKRIRKLQIWNL